MMTEPARPHSRKNRELLELAVEARLQYADYLHAVANGERAADPQVRKRLKSRCDAALNACRDAHLAWWSSNGTNQGRQ